MKPGDSVGPGFRVKGPLATNRWGTSYLVAETASHRRPRWVLKWLSTAAGQDLRQGVRADLADLASLGHACLALPGFLGRDRESGRGYLLRPFIQGSGILSALQGKSPLELLPWLVAAAEALGVLHRFGFLHRNLKAANLIVPRKALFARQPSGPLVVVCDPAWWPEESAADPTAKAAPDGQGDEPASFATDLYALGTVFYLLLTGKEAEPGEEGFPPSPTKAHPEVPLDLERAVLKLLNPDPRRRYQNATLLLKDLRSIRGLKAAPASVPPECFLGRDEELSRAASHLRNKEVPTALAVTGEAGMGKSSFLRRLTLEAQLLGYRTLGVRCYPEAEAPSAPLRGLTEQLIASQLAGTPFKTRFQRLIEETTPQPEPGARRVFLRRLLSRFLTAAESQPTLVVVDEAHVADPLTIEFLAELVKEIAALRTTLPGEEGPVLSVAVSYRTESPFRPALRPLVEALKAPLDGTLVLELSPLTAETVEQWLELALVDEPAKRDTIKIPQHFRGTPFAVREAIRTTSTADRKSIPAGKDLSAVYATYLDTLDADQQAIIEVLAVLGRPVSPDLLCSTTGVSKARLQHALSFLGSEGMLVEEGGLFFFKHGSLHDWLAGNLRPARRKALHGRVAAVLEQRPGESREELARHWLRSDAPSRGIPAALEAARHLVQNHEDRRALVLYRQVLELLPVRQKRLRQKVCEESADLCERTGELATGIAILKELIQGSTKDADAGRYHGRAGIYHHLAGEVTEATFHLERGLSLLANETSNRVLRDRLRMEAELAEIALNRGEYPRAEALCQRALGLLAQSKIQRDFQVSRAEMALLVNLGNLHLRRFDYETAKKSFCQAMEVGEKIQLAPERSLILNNLGVLHIQENRFDQALKCYEQARELSGLLGQDQMLVTIEANIAVLLAKTGAPEPAATAIRRAGLHDARCDSNRTRFLRLHSAGLVDLSFGRYAPAIQVFREAIALGEELEDHHMLAFDLVYLGECHLFRGETKAALTAFDRALALGSSSPAPILAMVVARKALLAAQRGDRREAAVAGQLCSEEATGQVGYLDAGNQLFLGWALRILGQVEEAAERLERARAFYSKCKVPAGEIHAQLELAALETDRGKVVQARKRLQAIRSRYTVGQGALANPMLCARLLAYETRVLLEQGDPDAQEATSLLVEAEGYLIGRRLLDLETLVRNLRRRIHLARLECGGTGMMPRSPSQDAAVVIDVVTNIKNSTADLIRGLEEAGGERLEKVCHQLRRYEEQLGEVENALEGQRPHDRASFGVHSIIGQSPQIKKLTRLIRQIAPSGLPVLITGETGTGKELVGRAIHGESPLRAAPFVTVNCAAFPESLLEAELFGYSRGAFTGAEEDHPGLLLSAQGGTFLFDEIGETPLSLQGKLLRVLDRGRVRPLGGTDEVELDLRTIFSTNRDLAALADEGSFRRDLLYRIRAVELEVPPLRDRIQDLPALIEHFQHVAHGGAEGPLFTENALNCLASYTWPGNVRELQNVVTRLALTTPERVEADHVRLLIGEASTRRIFSAAFLRSGSLAQLYRQLEREYLLQLHRDRGGDLKAMAASQGITLRALYKRFKRLGIDPGDLRS